MLVTRPRTLTSKFVDELEARGAIALVAPVIAIEPPDDPAPLRDALRDLHEFAWCAFSSANGVDAFVDAFDTPADATRALQTTRIAAVGPLTAERLRRHGLSVAAVPTEFVGESLADAILARARSGTRVLVVRAQEGREVLSDALRRAGLAPMVVAAYRTVHVVPDDFDAIAGSADAITFASSSAVTGFVAAAGGAERAHALAADAAIACIGPIAANTAREAGFDVVVIPQSYTGRGMVDALSAHFRRTA